MLFAFYGLDGRDAAFFLCCGVAVVPAAIVSIVLLAVALNRKSARIAKLEEENRLLLEQANKGRRGM